MCKSLAEKEDVRGFVLIRVAEGNRMERSRGYFGNNARWEEVGVDRSDQSVISSRAGSANLLYWNRQEKEHQGGCKYRGPADRAISPGQPPRI